MGRLHPQTRPWALVMPSDFSGVGAAAPPPLCPALGRDEVGCPWSPLPPGVRLTQGPAMWVNLMLPGGVRLGRQQKRPRAGVGWGTPGDGLAVPSPGEETGQGLAHPLLCAKGNMEPKGWGMGTDLLKLRPGVTPSQPASVSHSPLKHSGSKSYTAPGSTPRVTGNDSPHKGTAQGAVGSLEGFLEEESAKLRTHARSHP